MDGMGVTPKATLFKALECDNPESYSLGPKQYLPIVPKTTTMQNFR